MLVLLDIEWIQNQKNQPELTQIAAARVDEQWNPVENFTQIICPSDPDSVDWDHMAYCGYEKSQFLAACAERDAAVLFQQWLLPDDQVCLWSHSAKQVFRKKWIQIFGHGFGQPGIKFMNYILYQKIHQHGLSANSFYEAARLTGSDDTLTAHCAEDDVVLMRRIMEHFAVDPRTVLGIKNPLAQRKKWLEKSPFTYFYTASSEVFHIHSCPVLLRASELMGCATYKTAIRHRRPCKLCQPPAPSAPPVPQPKPKAKNPDEWISVRLLDGSVVETYRNKIVGCCHYNLHPGKMTEKILLKHDCVAKECPFFEKYEKAEYWKQLEARKKAKEKQKRDKAAKKKAASEQEEMTRRVAEEVQYYLDLCGYEVDVIEVRQETPTRFKVFYVSDKAYNDWREFPEFYGAMGHAHPNWRVIMQHIRDETGRFVTIDEFYARRRG